MAAGKAEAAVRDLFGDDSVAPQLRALVGAGETRDMSREELFEAWRRFLERLAARYPLVLVLDDIHWADDGLLDFIDHVADWAQGPILVIATARAELFEKRPTWGGGKRNATSIYLDPLSTAEGEAMLDDLLPGPVQPELKRTIVERSEGNPLYVEEIVRKLIDDGVLRATEASKWEVARPVAGIDLPRSVQGLIAARLDGLAEDEKAVLQDAAVVGRVFWVGALVELTGRPMAEVRDALGRLRVKELVVPHEPSSFRDEPWADPRWSVRLAAQVPASRQAPRHRRLGGRSGRRPRGGDRGGHRDARNRGRAVLRRARRTAPGHGANGIRTCLGCRPTHIGSSAWRGEHALVPRGRAPSGSAGDPAGRAKPARPRAGHGIMGQG